VGGRRDVNMRGKMIDKIIVLTRQRLSLFKGDGSSSVIREYLQGEESQDISPNSGESLIRVLDYIREAKLLDGCHRLKVMYDEELDTGVLNSLVDFIMNEEISFEVIQFKTMLPVLILKSVSTEIIYPLHVQLCDIAYRIDIDDTTPKIQRQDDPESDTAFVWTDESLAKLTINDSYPTLNACITEELQGKIQKLEADIGFMDQDYRTIQEDLNTAKQEIVLKTLAHIACLEELQVFKDKEQKEQKRLVFKALDIPRLADYLRTKSKNVCLSFDDRNRVLTIKRIVGANEMVSMNQPIFQVTFDPDNYSEFGRYESIIKAGRSGQIYCFSKALGKSEIVSLKDLFEKMRNSKGDYNPVLFVIADEIDNQDEILRWCWAQGYDVYE
jgi:hypothetical protein